MSDSIAELGALGLGIGVIIFLVVIAAITSIALYVLICFPLYKTLQAAGYDLAVLAWIPFCQGFVIVQAFNYKNDPNFQVFGISIPRPLAGFAPLIGAVLGSIPYIGFVFSILAVIVYGFILCDMFDVCDNVEPGHNTGMGIISSLIVFVEIYMFFHCMNKANNGEIDVEGYGRAYGMSSN